MSAFVKTASPHIHSFHTVRKQYGLAAAALLPALALGLFFFKVSALKIFGASLAGVLTAQELAGLWNPSAARLRQGETFLLAAVFGLMVPLNAPAVWIFFAAAVSVFFSREILGGVFYAPCLARLVLETTFLEPPLAPVPADAPWSGWAILAGGLAFLFLKRVRWEIPLLYLSFLSAASFLPALSALRAEAGGVCLAAFWIITDTYSTPLARPAMRIFSISAAVLTAGFLFSLPFYGALGAAVLTVNAVVPWLDEWFCPRGKK